MFILSMSLISKAFAPDSIFGRDSPLTNLILGVGRHVLTEDDARQPLWLEGAE
jgi:hypothetical protein